MLIKPNVYEWFCRYGSTGSGLLIRPDVYEEFDIAPQPKGYTMCFLLQPIPIGDSDVFLFLCPVGVWRLLNCFKNKTTFWRFPGILISLRSPARLEFGDEKETTFGD